VVELKPKSALAQRMDDKSLAVFLLGVDATLGLPVGRAPEGEIKEYNGIFYGTCVLPNNGGKLSIAVCNGHALAISGSIASIIIHLKPAARGDRKESAPGPTTTTGSASARTEQKPSLLRRLKDLLGK